MFPVTSDKSINIVKNAQIQPVIRLMGWIPDGVCSISSGELLVSMNNDNHTHSKVVRYSDFK